METLDKEKNGISLFIFYWMIFSLGSIFVSNGFKFIAYDLTNSDSIVSLVGSVSGVAFITLGLFSGIIVSASSNRFFIYFHLIIFSILSCLIYILFYINWLGVGMLFFFILLHGMTASLHSAAANRIFYDLSGTLRLSIWLSRRNIAVSVGSVSALILLSFFVEKSSMLFVIYAIILSISIVIFIFIHYKDSNIKINFNSLSSATKYVKLQFLDFISFSWNNKTIRVLFLLSFIKTFFIYWSMSAGILLKLGIDNADMRRLYLLTLIFMEFISIISLFFLGKKKNFSNRTFLWGSAVSALGILIFSLLENVWFAIASLSLMYIGFAICQMASGYILRLTLPERFRTQGISFAVIPYYFADIFSGVFFASLLAIFSVQKLLIFSGGSLLLLCMVLMPFIPLAKNDV